MAKSTPDTIPHPWDKDELLTDAYKRGWNHGHGIACHNVPTLGDNVFNDELGRVTVDAENIREVHKSLCHVAAEHSRSYSPFEFTAKEFNESEYRDDLWEAFEAGTADAINADLAEYDDEIYGIEPDADDEPEDDAPAEFSVEFATTNAAFDENAPAEVARILRDLADRIENGDLPSTVRDVNGNTIGAASWS